jgi:two-component system nitrate/nitrite response regulator NarL
MLDHLPLPSSPVAQIKVAIFDHATLAAQHSYVLRQEKDIVIVGTAQKPWHFFNLVDSHNPDVALVEIDTLRDTELALDMLGDMKEKHPRVKCLVYTVKLQPEFFVQAVRHKVDAYVFKASWERKQHELSDLLRFVHNGPGVYEPVLVEQVSKVFDRVVSLAEGTTARGLMELTAREQDVVNALVADPGAKDEVLAAALGITHGTIGHHLGHIFRKLHVNTRQEVIAAAILKVLLTRILSSSGSEFVDRT